MTPDLSLCLIVRDEKDDLENCAASFQGLFSRLIVTDTGSNDGTFDIARSLKAETFKFPWNDDFSAARNFILGKVSSTWTMMVDADDRIDPSDKEILISSLQDENSAFDGILLPYVYAPSGSAAAGPSAYLPRIWRTRLRLRYDLPVHEYLSIPPKTVSRFIALSACLRHEKKPDLFRQSAERNVRIMEKYAGENKLSPRLAFYLAHDNQLLGNFRDALKWYAYCVRESVKQDELNRAYLGMGICNLHIQEIAKAKEAFIKAVEANSAFIEPYLHLGDIAVSEGRFQAASDWYGKAASCPVPRTHVFTDYSLYGGFAAKKLQTALSFASYR